MLGFDRAARQLYMGKQPTFEFEQSGSIQSVWSASHEN